MTAGRKWMVAIVVALVGVLVLYYGFIAGGGEEPGPEDTVTSDPALALNDEEAMERSQPTVRDPVLERNQSSGNDFLSNSMNTSGSDAQANRTLNNPQDAHATGPYAVIGPDGTVRPVTIAHDPNQSLIRDLSNTQKRPVVNPDPGKGDVVVPPIDDPVKTAASKPATPAGTPAIAPTTVPPKMESYVVKDGETMSSIAAAWFGDARKWDLIAKANPLVDPKKMQVGQKLNLPPKTAEREKPKPGASEYTVRPGDTLVSIARAVYGDGSKWKAIYDANKSTIGSDPDDIREGTKLRIPERS